MKDDEGPSVGVTEGFVYAIASLEENRSLGRKRESPIGYRGSLGARIGISQGRRRRKKGNASDQQAFWDGQVEDSQMAVK